MKDRDVFEFHHEKYQLAMRGCLKHDMGLLIGIVLFIGLQLFFVVYDYKNGFDFLAILMFLLLCVNVYSAYTTVKRMRRTKDRMKQEQEEYELIVEMMENENEDEE